MARFSADPDNVPAWYKNIQSVAWESPRPLQVGSRVAFVTQFLGRRLAYTYEVAEYEPAQQLVMRTSEGPFPMETSYRWTAIDEQTTQMTLRNRGNPTGFSRWMTPFMSWMIARANRQDLACLKRLLEGRNDRIEADRVQKA